MSADGCIIDAPLILTKEEYSAKVLFDREGLLQLLLLPSGESPDYSLPHDLMIDDDDNSIMVAFNFGDLLTHIPIFERAKWKPFYRGMKAEPASINHNHLDRLLFFDFKSTRESDIAMGCWQARLDKIK